MRDTIPRREKKSNFDFSAQAGEMQDPRVRREGRMRRENQKLHQGWSFKGAQGFFCPRAAFGNIPSLLSGLGEDEEFYWVENYNSMATDTTLRSGWLKFPRGNNLSFPTHLKNMIFIFIFITLYIIYNILFCIIYSIYNILYSIYSIYYILYIIIYPIVLLM